MAAPSDVTGFHVCAICRGLIWPWQRVGWRVQSSHRGKRRRVVYWHGKHWMHKR